ncbi:MAG: ABC transporter ATP-binding protein, partial [Acidobacteria bacterium]|nr:ABC transporter ATP-binding protein [Acidobacteriota bacterium]
MAGTILQLCQISRIFGSTRAVDRLNLEIQEGEIFTLLGPSGCGKSTTLRLITGLERPDEGEIYLRGKAVASVSQGVFIPTHKRNMGMVFQSYAIWPHLTVFENVAYPLRAHGVRGAEVKERVSRALALVNLQGLEDRPGPLLSGGQQQRVALARAMIYEPDILLLDEPFSSLDAKLRDQMRVELKQLQRRVGITVLFVTHDQVEALSLSDRIAVMESGRAVQVGSPQQLYERPEKPFIRDFLGKSVVLHGRIARVGPENQLEVVLAGKPQKTFLIHSNRNVASVSQPSAGQRVFLSIRPEDIIVGQSGGQPGAGENRNEMEGTIAALQFQGDRYECHVQVGEDRVVLYYPRPSPYRVGQTIRFYLPATALSVWTQ